MGHLRTLNGGEVVILSLEMVTHVEIYVDDGDFPSLGIRIVPIDDLFNVFQFTRSEERAVS